MPRTPIAGFRPDPGLIEDVVPPSVSRSGATVRWDAGVAPGWRVPSHYDSLIGKVIVHAPTRAEAISASKEALSTLRVTGIKTTIPFHVRLLENPVFVSGAYDIAFVSRMGDTVRDRRGLRRRWRRSSSSRSEARRSVRSTPRRSSRSASTSAR
jgi:acetyl-CoA carboxylase biotin carboxylase subunit